VLPQIHGGDGGGRTVHQFDALGDQLGNFAIRRQRGQMFLPQVNVTTRQFVNIRFVRIITHGRNYNAMLWGACSIFSLQCSIFCEDSLCCFDTYN